MIASLKELALLGFLTTSSFAAVIGLDKRQAEPTSFKLYAYGGNTIGGYPIFFADGTSPQAATTPS